MFPGFGTLVNVATVIIGSALGLLLGHRLPDRTRNTITDALGLVTLLVGGLAAFQVTSVRLAGLVGPNAGVLIVLGSMLIGGIIGSLINIELRLERLGDRLRSRFGGADASAEPAARTRFIEGFVTASLVFCVGPLTILAPCRMACGSAPTS